MHIKKLLDNGRKKVNQLHSRLLLLSVIRPSIYKVWK